MPTWIIRLFLNAIAIMFSAWLLEGVQVNGFLGSLWVAIALSIINTLVRPIMIVLTIPITLVTFGIFLLFVDTFMILLADWLLDSLLVDGFWWAFLFGLVISVVNTILQSLTGTEERNS